MKFTIPESLGMYKKTFILKVFDCLFPEAANQTGYSYSHPMYELCDELDLFGNINPEHRFVRYLIETNLLYKKLFGDKNGLKDKLQSYKDYLTESEKSYGPIEGRTVNSWLSTSEDEDKRFNTPYKTAYLFAYLILSSESVTNKKRIEFYKMCLETLGVSDIDEIVWQRMIDFRWDETRNSRWDVYTVDKITDKAILFFSITVGVVVSLFAQKDKAPVIEAYHQLFNEFFADEINAAKPYRIAQEQLFECVKIFEPRSINKADTFYPEQYYIPADFQCRSLAGSETPIVGMSDSEISIRNIICAKTGFGKSAYIQMITLCMLANALEKEQIQPQDRERLSAIKAMGETLGVPEGKTVISIPARMFSYCFNKKTAGIANDDFVELFFDCMWNLSSKYNFYSPQNLKTTALARDDVDNTWQYTGALKDYITHLAKNGKLVLLLDSFDEISQGDMRVRYYKAISKFYDDYCNYPGADCVGAHIVMTTREMSRETMAHIYSSLKVESDAQKFTIKELSDEGKLSIISKWCVGDQMNPEEVLTRFKENHFYHDYSVNPYMLSVVCAQLGANFSEITNKLMETLIARMQANNSRESFEIQDVLSNIRDILQTIAMETVLYNRSSFTSFELSEKLREHMDTSDMTQEQIDSNIKKLHSIFVTEVGLIVPADGEDKSYQFINSQIRYQLATDGFRQFLSKDKRSDYMKKLLSRDVKMSEYTGLLVPLLCAENLENINASEELIRGLILHDYNNDEDAFYLVRAMIDLVTGKYGTSIATVMLAGDIDRDVILKCQRMLIIRLLSAANFNPGEKEKAEILSSAAYKNSESWICDALKNILTA